MLFKYLPSLLRKERLIKSRLVDGYVMQAVKHFPELQSLSEVQNMELSPD